MIEFKTIKWKNFLSTGNNFTEVNLNDHNKTLIIGENGAGKSTILDALCFGLFNKPFRKITKPQLINSVNLADCRVEIQFTIGKVDWQINRGMKPTVFEIYKNGVQLNQSASAAEQQKWFEQNVLKLNYKSFTQIVVLGSSTFVPFMQLPAAGRREVIEDILDIRIFSAMNTVLKDRIKENKEAVSEIDYSISLLKDKVDVQKRFIEDLKKQGEDNVTLWQEEITKLELDIKSSHLELERYMRDIDTMTHQMNDLPNPQKELDKLNEFHIKFRSKIKDMESSIKFLTSNDVCPTCNQDITEEFKNYNITSGKEKISKLESALEDIDSKEKTLTDSLNQRNTIQKEINQVQNKINNCFSAINWKQNKVKETENQIQSIKSNTDNVDREREKMKTLIEQGKGQELQRRQISKRSTELKIIADILKDGGVKSTIIRKYLPVMNTLINKHLQELEFYVNFNLDDTFNETIKSRFRDEFSYASFSEGEKMRIDLALLFTWREVAKLKNSVNTNILILDEIFDSSLDGNGTADFINILRTVTDGNNVFVISHKEDMLHDKFDNVIQFKKVKNFSKPFQTNGTTT
jgi:DNA repair exonuclease SbcCD ATPase subunit|tara:strand:+ start:938 stop:2671 length:1734 start_codon:yes stop_codon:yes gene_type:complete